MFDRCSWHNAPPSHRLDGDRLHVTTGAGTDFWRVTSYGFIRDSGHFFGMPVEGGFTAQLHVRAGFTHLYDQAGIMVRIDERRWLKAGVEFSDGQPMLGVVLTDALSDWSVMPAPPIPDGVWLRVTVDGGVIRIQYSTDGHTWPMLRLAPFAQAERYLVGPMCCTPERAGLEVDFRGFAVTPPLGKDLHDLS